MNKETSTLRSLANIIVRAVDSMERAYAEAALPLPSLDKPFSPEDPAEALAQDSHVATAAKNLVAACAQISATVWNPRRFVTNQGKGYNMSSCLRAVSDFNVVDVLREAGENGASVNDIGAAVGVDPRMIERILRLLATHHIFREVSPGVFANNRISSTLEKAKPSRELFQSRETRFVGSSGIAAFVENDGEVGGKCALYLAESLRTPGLVPFNLAYDTKETLFEWMEGPERSYHVNRFASAMQGTAAMEPGDLIFRGFDWSALPRESVIVDVGGGIGHESLTIAKKYPHLRVVNQDFASPIEFSKAHWKKCFPEHVEKGMVEFLGESTFDLLHDFFTPQSVKNAAVFLLRHIIHDWPDDRALVILQNLRKAAGEETQLVVIDKLVPFASTGTVADSKMSAIRGAEQQVAEAPLLPNWGPAAADVYLYDLTMHLMVGGIERTAQGFYELFAKAGWKLVEIHQSPGTQMSHIVGVPARGELRKEL
ncbi:S-adenosyl-L-methionine-dependent methyltransferase [Favolaschia claudopus]|uniref:S-adenosyl-L-methionine-dependent methyltransferase n=1 Tax=Favolaschia claudopus TaxID=2862362 RepID=A0AAW0A7Q4_9AGAR